MHLIQILLPVSPEAAESDAAIAQVTRELRERFGGYTAYTRAPAEGGWRPPGRAVVHDDVIVVEVMSETLDAEWWKHYRHTLEARFQQQSLVIRANEIILL